MRAPRPLRPLLLLAAVALAGVAGRFAAGEEGAPDAPLDYRFYKARVAPVLHEACGACHADPRQRSKMGRFFLRPAPGRRIRERFHERNFEGVLGLVTPGDPSSSLLLLKAIGPREGGVTHEGGAVLGTNTPEYGAIIDWINGSRAPPETFTPPAGEEGQPDFAFFHRRIAPVLMRVCAECHEGRGQGRFRLITPLEDGPLPLESHYENFRTVLDLLVPGRPERSRFLQKPLALEDGGIRHRGGDRIRKGTPTYEDWVLFIQGERGPPIETGEEPESPLLTAAGLAVQAEDLERDGDLDEVEMEGAQAWFAVVPATTGGSLRTVLRVADAGAYEIVFRLAPGRAPPRWALGDGETRALAIPPDAEPDEHGFVEVGPRILLDGSEPLVDARGALALRDEVLHMDGRAAEAAWLSPVRVPNEGVLARVRVPHEEDGGDDALVLFDMDDGWNGKFAGLADGGRRFVMGVIEDGTARVLAAAKTAPTEDEDAPREIKVDTFAGVAVGSLDGRAVAHLNLDKALGEGAFGFLTHGLAAVEHVAALEEYEVYAVDFRSGPVLHLPEGPLALRVDLPAEGGALDAVIFRPPAR